MSSAADPRTGRLPVVRRVQAAVDPAVGLLSLLPESTGGAAFVVGEEGLVGWGSFASMRTSGADAAGRLSQWFREICEQLRDAAAERGNPAPDPVCFVSLGFAPSDESVAVIPLVTVRRSAGRVTMTTIDDRTGATPPAIQPVTAPGQIRYADADLSTTDFMGAVEVAIARIRSGVADKVVLAHGLAATAELPVDERFLLGRLAARYPSCAVFAVEGLVGASPEMLIHRRGRDISSRVLAGTAWPERAAAPDATESGMHRVAEDLAASAKDLAEHRFAADSVARALAPVAASLHVPAGPSTLELANLTHLATDITGELAGSSDDVPTALDLAALLHPTAAVGGTPSGVAQRMIAELERAPRGRYAAPVGWMGGSGDGDFAIALRCATVAGRTVTMMAGCGIVAGSDPRVEAREAQIKMLPIRDALEG